MKKLIQYIFLFALMGILSQCKKGEDDPFLSLHTRKARVAGEWHLTSGSDASTSGNSSTTYNYTETSYTENYANGGVSTSTAGLYSLKMTFKKDGSFTYTEIKDNNTTTLSGMWNFTAGVGKEYKNKQQIILKMTSYTSSSQNSSSSGTYTGKDMDFAFSIKELRNKKMVLVTESTSASGSSVSTSKTELVLEQ